MELLTRINSTGTTVVMATHDDDLVDRARRRVVELVDGRVVRDEAGGAYLHVVEAARRAAGSDDGDALAPANADVGRGTTTDEEAGA
jgi:energy-coupling factor transporter ATP-binding protein EcfA2